MTDRPSVGRIVHYVSYGTPGGEFSRQCRAAIITDVRNPIMTGGMVVSLCVLNPAGQFFNTGVMLHRGTPVTSGPADAERPLPGVLCDGLDHPGGTWHWPART